jgi:hypothetical protein
MATDLVVNIGNYAENRQQTVFNTVAANHCASRDGLTLTCM